MVGFNERKIFTHEKGTLYIVCVYAVQCVLNTEGTW